MRGWQTKHSLAIIAGAVFFLLSTVVFASDSASDSIIVGGTVPSPSGSSGGGSSGASSQPTTPAPAAPGEPEVERPEVQNPIDREILGLPPLPPPTPPAPPPSPPTGQTPPAPPIASVQASVPASSSGSSSGPNILGQLRSDVIGVRVGNGSIPSAIINGKLSAGSNDTVIITVTRSSLSADTVRAVEIIIGGKRVPLTLDGLLDAYVGRVVMPAPGEYAGLIIVQYDDVSDALSFSVGSLPYGLVTDSFTGAAVAEAFVYLYDESAGGHLWKADKFGQVNPVVTSDQGAYRFIVPNGNYRLVVKKNGYRDRKTFSFPVANTVINQSLRIIKLSDGSILGLARENLNAAEETLLDALKKARELADNPRVEDAVEQVVTPVAVGVVGISVLSALWSSIVPLLRFMFFQPLLLLGIRRRKDWGLVYNSLSKLPVDLATVRLVEADTNTVVRSQVTDKNGRYVFLVKPGHYVVRVEKKGYIFPTHVLAQIMADGLLANVYHGDTMEVKDDGRPILVNIPIDPEGKEKTPRRILWEKRLRLLQQLLSYTGIITTAISLYIKPSLIIVAYLFGHIILYVLFVKFVNPSKPKGWGTVTDALTNEPLGRVIVRLYHSEYNKLIATELTSAKGRYVFLVGPGSFYTTYEKAGYEPYRSQIFSFADQTRVGGLVKKNAALRPVGGRISANAEVEVSSAVPTESVSAVEAGSLEAEAEEQKPVVGSRLPEAGGGILIEEIGKDKSDENRGDNVDEEIRRQVREWWDSGGSGKDS